MSMRPVDLQTVMQRVTEVARAGKVGEQGQEKVMAQAAGQNQEAARKGREEVKKASQPESDRVTLRRDRRSGHGDDGSRQPDSEGSSPDDNAEPKAGSQAEDDGTAGRLDLLV